MDILILDDDNSRHRVFMAAFAGPEFTTWHVDTATRAIKALQRQKFDVVFLDHDLGGFLRHPRLDPGDGLEVAEFLALHMDRSQLPATVVVHSHNPPAAIRMANVLREANIPLTVAPFGPSMIQEISKQLKAQLGRTL